MIRFIWMHQELNGSHAVVTIGYTVKRCKCIMEYTFYGTNCLNRACLRVVTLLDQSQNNLILQLLLNSHSVLCNSSPHKHEAEVISSSSTARSHSQIRLPAPLTGILMKHCLYCLHHWPRARGRQTLADWSVSNQDSICVRTLRQN